MHITITEDINIHIVVFDITSIIENMAQLIIMDYVRNLKKMLEEKY